MRTIFSSDTVSPFKNNSEHLSNRAQKAPFVLNAHVNNRINFLEPYIAFKMFDVHINPILQHGAEIWSKTKQVASISIETLYLGYLKHVLWVKHSSCTPTIYVDCCRFSIIITQNFQMIQYWHRILNLSENHILKYTYKSQLDLSRLGLKNWCNIIEDIINAVDLEYVLDYQVININILVLVKEKHTEIL